MHCAWQAKVHCSRPMSSSQAKPCCLPMMPESVSEHACTWYKLPIGAWLHMGACCVVLCSFWLDLHCACVVDFCVRMRTIVQFRAHGGPVGCCYRVRATARAHTMLLLHETPRMMLVHHFGGHKLGHFAPLRSWWKAHLYSCAPKPPDAVLGPPLGQRQSCKLL